LGGAFGFIFGRNMWKREKKDALRVTKLLQNILDKKANPFFTDQHAQSSRKAQGISSQTVKEALHMEHPISVS
jgi:hypothetical protein